MLYYDKAYFEKSYTVNKAIRLLKKLFSLEQTEKTEERIEKVKRFLVAL